MADILLADDDLGVRTRYLNLLGSEGYTVRGARDGEEAVSLFTGQRPDLVILDADMPSLNGFGALAAIRRLDPLVPVLFLTCHDSEVNAVRALGMGADDYIVKGSGESRTRSDAEFLSRVRRALERAAVYRQSAAAPSASVSDALITIGTVVVDLNANIARGHDIKPVKLQRMETALLSLLASQRGRLFHYAEILEYLAERSVGVDPTLHSVQSCLHALKSKLGASGSYIVNQRLSGYRLQP